MMAPPQGRPQPPKLNRQKMRDFLRGKLAKTTEEREKHNNNLRRGRPKQKRPAFL